MDVDVEHKVPTTKDPSTSHPQEPETQLKQTTKVATFKFFF